MSDEWRKRALESWRKSLKRPKFRVQKFRSHAAIVYCASKFVEMEGNPQKAYADAQKTIGQYAPGTVERDFWVRITEHISSMIHTMKS